MKVLIWLACILVYSALQVVIRSQGIALGGVPTVLLALLLVFIPAPALCKLWEKRKKLPPAIPHDERKERWYTCQKCGQLVREGEDCDCEPKAVVEEQEEDKPKKRNIAVPILSAACVVLAICTCFLAYMVSSIEAERAQLATENTILNNTLHDLSDENADLQAQIDGKKTGSFSEWTEWKKLYDDGFIKLSYEEWLVFTS